MAVATATAMAAAMGRRESDHYDVAGGNTLTPPKLRLPAVHTATPALSSPAPHANPPSLPDLLPQARAMPAWAVQYAELLVAQQRVHDHTIDGVARLLAHIDRGNTGVIDGRELNMVLRTFGVARDTIERIAGTGDKCQDRQKINCKQFLQEVQRAGASLSA